MNEIQNRLITKIKIYSFDINAKNKETIQNRFELIDNSRSFFPLTWIWNIKKLYNI